MVNETLAEEKRQKLVAASQPGAKPVQKFDYERCHRSDDSARAKACLRSGKESVFEAVEVSLKLPKDFFYVVKKNGDSRKWVLNITDRRKTKDCVVYAAGINHHS